MDAISLAARETRRLEALQQYDILDTPREAAFDEVAALAAKLCGTSIAVVNLIGGGRQFFKAEVGLGVRETPLESSFCVQAILEKDFLLVPDATSDPRFACNPLVIGEPHLRFYAGALLKTADGLPIGTLCVLDTAPHDLSELQQESLRVLANQVMAQLELRRALRLQHESEARHREGEEKLRFAMEAAGQGAWELDLRTFAFTATEQCLVNFGHRGDASLDYAGLVLTVHPDDQPMIHEAVREAIASRGVYDLEYRRHPDLGEGWIHVTGRCLYAADGMPETMLGVSNDITARKADQLALIALNATLEQRVEATIAEREQAQSALRQSQKMEAIGQLTGGVAHDFNNLLTPILGSLDLLQRRTGNSAREARLIDGALQSAERARTLVQRLLAFARRQPLRPGAVDVAALVRGMIALIGGAAGPGMVIETRLEEGLPAAAADVNQLEMAILNLAVNARDAMPGGGTLTIEAVLDPACDAASGAPCVRVSVIDTGCGMDADTAARAVEPFYSTKGVGKGTGLGLSMVHGLALQLGGAMAIESVVGQGTRVDLWLPLSEAPVEPVAVEVAAVPSRQARGRVLVVDDEDVVRMTTADMLQSIGYEPVEADGGPAAQRLLAAGERFDLVVTDHLMPDMSGAELAASLKADWPAMKVLIVSGYAEADGVAPGVARLAKPFREIELARAIAELG